MNKIVLTSEKRRQARNLNLMFFVGFIFGFFIGFHAAKEIYGLKSERMNAVLLRIEEKLEILGGGYYIDGGCYE